MAAGELFHPSRYTPTPYRRKTSARQRRRASSSVVAPTLPCRAAGDRAGIQAGAAEDPEKMFALVCAYRAALSALNVIWLSFVISYEAKFYSGPAHLTAMGRQFGT
jgi:hypothetical protein